MLRDAPVGGASNKPVLMACLEKAILDYCYLYPHLTTVDDFATLQLNATLLREHLDYNRLDTNSSAPALHGF